jgi:hypothetical protein
LNGVRVESLAVIHVLVSPVCVCMCVPVWTGCEHSIEPATEYSTAALLT